MWPIQLSYNDHLFSIKNHIWFLLMKSNLGFTNPSNFQNTLIHYLPKNVIFVFSFWVIQWKDSVFYFCFYFIQCSNKISLSVLSHKYVLQLTKNTLCKYFSSPWIFKLEIYFYPKSHKLLKMKKLYYCGNVTEINDNKIEIYPDLSTFFRSHLNWNCFVKELLL